MIENVITPPEALDDLVEARAGHENRTVGLGDRFRAVSRLRLIRSAFFSVFVRRTASGISRISRQPRR